MKCVILDELKLDMDIDYYLCLLASFDFTIDSKRKDFTLQTLQTEKYKES